MDFLSLHSAKIDCKGKSVSLLKPNGERVIFQGQGNERKGLWLQALVSTTPVVEENIELGMIRIVNQYPKVFLERSYQVYPHLEKLIFYRFNTRHPAYLHTIIQDGPSWNESYKISYKH